ncbi:hypothetical protein TVAG_019350 [Trichomonas vaginalis G3]|uniref:Uncharacterized protein n=1 Tax=Trichomonas vaginalis (strain ATCC PRA-98 / G3) TaxID=412133 RepID=A2DX08_TRIV3|nr:hypothetical protein TVAGG3_0184990 [Trichomonas vaginalis G3]EAY15035.1 hypothetical protein TVAG_019350 [Trichomonas vaginalis G3]KAI5549576.1 hypothetical protein TVAGG3_0184990 [Trichomonas vaginalis G3]|eukprot:XP_001327258.1 hypothetical protein [Trichomonas vaginalis G3]
MHNFDLIDKESLAMEMFKEKVFSKNLEKNCLNYFKVCSVLLEKGENTVEAVTQCINLIWDKIRWVVINLGKSGDVFSMPKLPSEIIMSYLVQLAGFYVQKYAICFAGKKSFFGKDYVQEMKSEWKEKKIDPNYLLNVSVSQKVDFNGFYQLIVGMSYIDENLANSTLRSLQSISIMDKAAQKTKNQVSKFLDEFSEIVLSISDKNLQQIEKILVREFCSQMELYDSLSFALSRIIQPENVEKIDKHISDVLKGIVEINCFNNGLLQLCIKIEKQGKLASKGELVSKAMSLFNEVVRAVNRSHEQKFIVSALNKIKSGAIFVKTLDPSVVFNSINEIITLGIKVRQFGQIEASNTIEDIESVVLG